MALSSTKNNIFKKVKDYVQKQDGLYPVSRDTSSDTVFMGNSNASNVNTLTTVVGDGNYTSGDNGEMAEGLYSDSLIPKITDNESFTSAMPKLTRIVNNVRYLVHALGTSDITQIGDGTITGAISTLNSNCNELILVRSASTHISVSPSTDTQWAIDIPLVSGYTVLGYIYLGSSYSSQVVLRPEGITSDKCYGYARSITNSISVFDIGAVFLYAKSYKM